MDVVLVRICSYIGQRSSFSDAIDDNLNIRLSTFPYPYAHPLCRHMPGCAFPKWTQAMLHAKNLTMNKLMVVAAGWEPCICDCRVQE